ncbi:ATP-binding protein [Alteromonas ponticola]|uniref:histidine kinase n=1 Tax=Alteromonas aquimaris TaxID=2998417 RepID=A0ABT3P8Q9_9ALTE|nr:ATP-binding protein [Alteromonas aquimaris]MCW8109143.1 ATP-binding protein [Alteromonas aquimaris]
MSKMRRVVQFLIFKIILAHCAYVAAGSTNTLSTTHSFKEMITGSLLSIESTKNGIWLGGENGLYGIVGKQTYHFCAKKTLITKSYISALKSIGEHELLVSVFGNGLFRFDTISHQFQQISPHLEDLKYVWDIDLSGTNIAISTIDNIYLLDAQTLAVTKNLKESGIVVGDNVLNLQFSPSGDTLWWIDRKKGLHSYALDSSAWLLFGIERYFRNTRELTSIFVEEENVYIGTDNSLKIFDVKTSEITSISQRPDENSKVVSPVRYIARDNKDNLWVAAERLYQFDKTSSKLISPAKQYPLFESQDLGEIYKIEITNKGDIYVLEAKNGLAILPVLSGAVSYVGGEKNLISTSIDSALFTSDDEFIFSTKSQVGWYNSLDKTYRGIDVGTPKQLTVIAGDANAITAADDSGALFTINRDGDTRKADSPFIMQTGKILQIEKDPQGRLIYIHETDEKDYLIRHAKYGDEKLLTGSIYTFQRSIGENIYVAAHGQGIYRIQKNGVTKKLAQKYNFDVSSIDCIFVDSKNNLFVCTSGNGLMKYSKSSDQFKRVQAIKSNYIRAISEINAHVYLLATNIGLFYYDATRSRSFRLGSEFGIPDTDFAYKGIYTSKTRTLVVGDNLNYLIDNQKLIDSIEETAQRINHVIISSFSAFDEETNLLKPINSRFYEAIKSGEKLELSNDEFMFELGLSVANFLERERLQIEYRLRGLTEEWTHFSDSSAQIVYSSLPFGNYIFETRVVDARSDAIQPISKLTIRVLPPFWLSPLAFIVYLLVSSVTGLALFRRYRRKLAVQANALHDTVNGSQCLSSDNSKTIRSALEQKQRLFTNISHELRTPLALVLGPLKQVKGKPNDRENPQRLALALDNAVKLEKLVDHLLEIEQVESLCENERKSYDIKADIPAILANVRPLADYKQQEFVSSIRGKGRISLIADSLEKICHNLVSNAVKYTDTHGKVKIDVTCQELHLVIKVSDTGCGIPEEDVSRIFNRFARGKHETEVVGSGVGLALVKELILANQGWIDVSSREGKGSIFTVYLPLHSTSFLLTASISQQAQSPRVLALPKPSDLPENKTVILLVEDNEDMRAYLYSLLKQKYTCLLARHGIEAMSIVKTVTPALIITDYMMPVMDGLTLADRLKAKENFAHIPIILLTARGDSVTQTKSLNARIEHCLIKPVTDEALMLRVENLLEQRQRLRDSLLASAESDHASDESADLPSYECDKDQAFYARFIAIVEKFYQEESFNRAQAASELAVSERQLNRKLASLLEYNFTEYLKNYRLKKSKALLRSGQQITQIALDVGFNSTSYFSSRFKAMYGMSPSQYQEMHIEEKKRA